jgi:hypothetical protein
MLAHEHIFWFVFATLSEMFFISNSHVVKQCQEMPSLMVFFLSLCIDAAFYGLFFGTDIGNISRDEMDFAPHIPDGGWLSLCVCQYSVESGKFFVPTNNFVVFVQRFCEENLYFSNFFDRGSNFLIDFLFDNRLFVCAP